MSIPRLSRLAVKGARRLFSSGASTAPPPPPGSTLFVPEVVGGAKSHEGQLANAAIVGATILALLEFRHLWREMVRRPGLRRGVGW